MLSRGCFTVGVAPPRKVKRQSRESETKPEEWIHLHLFLPVGLCTVDFPTEAAAGVGRSLPVTVLLLQETWMALPRSLFTSAESSEKMRGVLSSPEHKTGGVFSKLIASNLRSVY